MPLPHPPLDDFSAVPGIRKTLAGLSGLAVSPNEQFLIVSDRGASSVLVYFLDSASGMYDLQYTFFLRKPFGICFAGENFLVCHGKGIVECSVQGEFVRDFHVGTGHMSIDYHGGIVAASSVSGNVNVFSYDTGTVLFSLLHCVTKAVRIRKHDGYIMCCSHFGGLMYISDLSGNVGTPTEVFESDSVKKFVTDFVECSDGSVFMSTITTVVNRHEDYFIENTVRRPLQWLSASNNRVFGVTTAGLVVVFSQQWSFSKRGEFVRACICI